MSTKLVLLAVFVMSMIIMSFNYKSRKRKIVFFGDSITAAGAKAGGYIRLMDSLVAQEGSTDNYELIGAGIGGNKVYDLYLRMEEDVLSQSPDIVVIYIGVNDVWHKASSGTGTDYDKFGKFYGAIVRRLQAANVKVILCTPAVIGEKTDNSNQQDGDLNQYSNWIRSYAAKSNLPLVDLRKEFIGYNQQHNPQNKESGILTVDRVHLTHAGNLLVAEQMWQAIKSIK